MIQYVYLGFDITLKPNAVGRPDSYYWQINTLRTRLDGAEVRMTVWHGITEGKHDAMCAAEKAAREYTRTLRSQSLPVGFVPRPNTIWSLESILLDAGIKGMA